MQRIFGEAHAAAPSLSERVVGTRARVGAMESKIAGLDVQIKQQGDMMKRCANPKSRGHQVAKGKVGRSAAHM